MRRLFSLIGVELSAVSRKEKMLSGLGGLVAICLLVWITNHAVGIDHSACVIASMGASAVLLFGVPHGQLSQPWPLIAGHGLSATLGVLCAQHLGHDWIAAGCAVGSSILVMHLLKCIHPPGGATAMTAVVGGNAIHTMGFQFVLWPVMINVIIMLLVAVLFNWPFSWRRYPAILSRSKHPLKPHPSGAVNEHEDIVKALRDLDSFVDVTETDLIALSRKIAREREARILKQRRKEKD
ncbi:MAG: HPP family protein, partial [Roseimicrobium sp.]